MDRCFVWTRPNNPVVLIMCPFEDVLLWALEPSGGAARWAHFRCAHPSRRLIADAHRVCVLENGGHLTNPGQSATEGRIPTQGGGCLVCRLECCAARCRHQRRHQAVANCGALDRGAPPLRTWDRQGYAVAFVSPAARTPAIASSRVCASSFEYSCLM